MADAFIGEIRLFPYNFQPENWLMCDGRTLNLSLYQALFAIIQTTFGGDGKTSFNLPNLQGVVVMGQGQGPSLTNRQIGKNPFGTESEALTTNQTPVHNHTLTAVNANAVASVSPTNNYLAKGAKGLVTKPTKILMYNPSTTNQTQLNANALTPFIGSGQSQGQSHENRQPVLAMMYCICVADGVFPERPS